MPSGKTPKPISLLLFWDGMCPIPLSPSLWQAQGHVPPCTTRPMLQRSKGHSPVPGHWGNYEGPVAATALQKGDFGLYIPPVKGGQQETGQPISPVLSSRARTEGWGQQPAALDEEPGVPACSSVTLTPSCLGSAQPWLLEKDPGTLAWQTPAWGTPVGQVTSLDTSNLCSHCRRKTDLGRRRSGVGRQA